MEQKPRLRFALTRDVQLPKRAGKSEAGIDFFIPNDLKGTELLNSNENAKDIEIINCNGTFPPNGTIYYDNDDKGNVKSIIMGVNSRLVIPSGVKALIEPWGSALIAANKSGVSTKKGLTFGAQVVDSTYTGEIHISLINNSAYPQRICAGDKIIQFIHTPILLTKVESINHTDMVNIVSRGWSDRGSNWQGSTDNIITEPYEGD